MIVGEAVLTAIVDAVVGYTIEKGTDRLGEHVRERLGLDPVKKAFKEALGHAFEHLNQLHSEWVDANFDVSFFEHEGKPVLTQFLVMDGQPDPSELASRWADSLQVTAPERRAYYIRELEPIAADFLEDLAYELKSKEALRNLNMSRALDQATEAIQSLRERFGAEKATPGTLQDYLRWVINRNFYLDARGTFQTQRQVQLRLADVYISLQAQSAAETMSVVDRQRFEQELVALDAEGTALGLITEEREERRDLLEIRLERHLQAEKLPEVLELAEVVARHERVVILGDPGSGKSTLLRYLALKHAEALRDGYPEAGTNLGSVRFPLLVRIAEYSEGGAWREQALSEFLARCFAKQECPKRGLDDLLKSQLERGNCLVLLDGLDEVVNAEERLGVVRQVEDFVRRYGHKTNRFVITSRIPGYRNVPLGESFTHYTVREMNDAQIHHFLEHWCQAVEDAQTPDLPIEVRSQTARREIEGIIHAIQNPGVRRLASNPLLLRILALIHRTGARMPQKRIELYKLAADTLARTWRLAQGVSESALVRESSLLKQDYLTPLLSALAYWLHLHKSTGLATEREVYELLGKTWADLNDMRWDADAPNPKITEEIRKFLVAVHEHTGLFVERAPRRYGFLHLTFEEYYAARYLIDRPKQSATRIRKHLHQSRWEEPILLALGFVGLEYPDEASSLVETAILARGDEAEELGCTPSPYEDLIGRDYLFALRCLGDSIPMRPRLMKQLLERFIDELLHQTGSVCFERYRQALWERLAQLSGSEGDSLMLPLLVYALQHDTDARVRSNAARCLGQLGQASPEVIAALLQTLQHNIDTDVPTNPWFRRALGGRLSNWQHNIDTDVPTNAAWSLGQLGQASPEVIAALLRASHDIDADVRTISIWSLGQLGERSEEVIAALLNTLQYDVDASTRSCAARSLGKLGQASAEVIAALLHTLRRDADNDVRLQAARSLRQLDQVATDTIAVLLSALHDVRPNTRSNAAWSLGKLGQASAEAIAALLHTLLHDTDTGARFQAARSLGQLGQVATDVVAALLTALQYDSSTDVRFQAAQSLGQLGQPSMEVITALLNALQHDVSSHVRSYAAWSLGQLGQASAEVIATLLHTLQHDTDVNVRSYAAWSLGQLEQAAPEVITTLFYTLRHDTDTGVRFRAAWSLGQLGQTSAEVIVELCKTLQKASSEQLRREAARLLGQIGNADSDTIDILYAGILDEDGEVRTACVQALVQLGKRYNAVTQVIKQRLVQAISNPKFDKPDRYGIQSARDVAYRGLWLLVASSGGEEKA